MMEVFRGILQLERLGPSLDEFMWIALLIRILSWILTIYRPQKLIIYIMRVFLEREKRRKENYSRGLESGVHP